ncbi:MAG: hypothetical protein WED00_03865 [Aquisalimonadaceae bacterium]
MGKYKDRRKLGLGMALCWLAVSALVVVFEYWRIVFYDIPSINVLISDVASEAIREFVVETILRIVMHLSVWVFLYFVVLTVLIRFVQKGKQ